MNDDIDHPKIVDMTNPLPRITLHTTTGQPIPVDMTKFIEAAERLGLGAIQAGDVMSIGAHRNHLGEWKPNYDSIRIEREAKP